MKTPRNASCPCGSGRKYKRCCGPSAPAHGGSTPASDATQKLVEAIQASGASTLDEINSIARKFSTQRNERPLDEFLGLSPSQMQAMLYSPLDAPEIVTFETNWYPEESTSLDLFVMLIESIDDEGVKTTAQGNLPIAMCRAILINHDDGPFARIRRIRSEVEFEALHTMRIVGELAGLVKRRKNRFYITKQGRQLALPENRGRLFQVLFKTYVSKFNWGYRDGYPEAPFVQTAWLFSLYSLSLFGRQWRSSQFYIEQFMQVFPSAINEMDGDGFRTSEQAFRACYGTRSLERFAHFWGLAKKRASQSKKPYFYEYELRAPGLSAWLHFHC